MHFRGLSSDQVKPVNDNSPIINHSARVLENILNNEKIQDVILGNKRINLNTSFLELYEILKQYNGLDACKGDLDFLHSKFYYSLYVPMSFGESERKMATCILSRLNEDYKYGLGYLIKMRGEFKKI